jgi:hypothetical protein
VALREGHPESAESQESDGRRLPSASRGLSPIRMFEVASRAFVACSTACLLLLSGCAVTPTTPRAPPGKLVNSVRHSSDGSVASLWRDQDRYALTVRDLPAIYLPPVLTAKITDVRRVDSSTNVLIEISEQGCPHRYLLYGVRDGSARSWRVGDCYTPVRIASAGNRELFLFYTPDFRHVFEYRDHRIFEAIDRYSSRPPAPGSATPVGAPAISSGASQAAIAGAAPAATVPPPAVPAPGTTQRPATRSAPGKLPPPPSKMEFPPTERQPVVVDILE